MFQITTILPTTEQLGEIQRLRLRLRQAAVLVSEEAYEVINQESARDHRVEIPFVDASMMVDVLQVAKNVHYDNSYSKRGVFSIFFNMERKWERLATQLFNGDIVEAASESFLDTCVDLAAYAMKLVAWICVRRPDLYIKMLKYVEAEAVSTGVLKPDKWTPPGEAAFFAAVDKPEDNQPMLIEDAESRN